MPKAEAPSINKKDTGAANSVGGASKQHARKQYTSTKSKNFYFTRVQLVVESMLMENDGQ